MQHSGYICENGRTHGNLRALDVKSAKAEELT
jgi:hypothetical protein